MTGRPLLRSAWRAILLSCLVGAARRSGAQPPARSIERVVQRGDTFESLAVTYYGDRAQALFIRGLNARERLPVGRKVRIPTAITVKLKKGETLVTLAKRFLGDPRRARFLAEWNGLKERDRPPAGTGVVVPFHLVHRVRAPESLAALAKTFFGDAGQGRLLAAYNFRATPLLGPGERVIIPVPHVRIRPAVLAMVDRARARGASALSPRSDVPPPERGLGVTQASIGTSILGGAAPLIATGAPVVAAAPAPATSAMDAAPAASGGRIAERIKVAERAWREGSYEDAQSQLTRLLEDAAATPPHRLAIHRLLGFVYASVGADDDAVREFRAVLALDPALRLEESQVSPRIRAVFERARASR